MGLHLCPRYTSTLICITWTRAWLRVGATHVRTLRPIVLCLIRQHFLAKTKTVVFIHLAGVFGWWLYKTIHYTLALVMLRWEQDYHPSAEQPDGMDLLLRDGWTPYRIKKRHRCCRLWKEQLVNLGLGFSGAHRPSHTVFSISTLVGLKRERWETQHGRLWKKSVIDNMESPHLRRGQWIRVWSQKWLFTLSICQ